MRHEQHSHRGTRLRAVAAAYLTLFFYGTQLISCGPGPVQSQEDSRLGTARDALASVPFELRADTLLPTGPQGARAPGVTPFSADVTPNGTAAVSLPLWVPPGRLGLQPSLSITYDSQGGDGPLGVGFNLAGLSQITLCPNTRARDAAPNAIDFDPDTTGLPEAFYRPVYCLDGARLVEVGGSFRTERDSHARITVVRDDSGEPRAFEHRGRDGLIRTYGHVDLAAPWPRDDATLEGYVELNTPEGDTIATSRGKRVRLVWALAAVADRFGNRMDIFYGKTPAETETGVWQRPARIVYTQRVGESGVLEPGYREVTFHYLEREDTFTGYLAGVKVSRDFRLARIEMRGPGVSAGTDSLGPVLLRSYTLTYANDSISRRSLLEEVRECDGQEVCKSPVRFEWEKGSWDFQNLAAHPVPDAAVGAGLNAFGLGAGRTGLAYFVRSELKQEKKEDIFDPFTGATATLTHQEWRDTMRLLQLPTSKDTVLVASDVTGVAHWNPHFGIPDGGDFCRKRPDRKLFPLVADWHGSGHSTVTSLSCSWRQRGATSPFVPVYSYIREGSNGQLILGSEPNSQYFLDVNGDGFGDIVWMGRHEIDLQAGDTVDATQRRVVVLGSGSESPPGYFRPTRTGIRAVDLDASGKASLLGMGPSETPFMSRLSYHYDAVAASSIAAMAPQLTTVRHPSWNNFFPDGYFPRTFEFVDVNGDGLVDALTLGYTTWPTDAFRLQVQLNTSEGFMEAVSRPLHAGLAERLLSAKTEHGDFDGDGRTDLAVFKAGNPVYLMLAGPQGEFVRGVELPFSSGVNLEWAHVVDVNNDGLLDLTYQQDGRLNVALRASQTDVLKRVHGNTQLPDAEGFTGVNYTFEYAPLSNPNPHGLPAPAFPFYERRSAGSQGFARAVPETMRLVSRMVMASNKERLRSWRYSYRDGRTDTRGLGWLGFAWRAVIDEVTGAWTETAYDNTHFVTTRHPVGWYSTVWAPTAHLPLTEKTSVPAGMDEVLITERTWEYAFSTLQNLYYQQYVKRETETVRQVKAGTPTVLSESETLTELDAYGTPTRQRALVHGASTTEQVMSETAGIGFNETEWKPTGEWTVTTSWMSCPRAAPSAGCPGAADARNVRTQRFKHDVRGHIESLELEPSQAGEQVTPTTSEFYLKKTFTRNPLGLVTSVTSASSAAERIEKVTYDGIDQTSVASVTDAKGATWRYLFHPGLGVLAQTADPNGVHTRYQYDGFGRQRVVTPLFQGDLAPGNLSIVRTFYEWGPGGLPRIRAAVDTAPGVSDESITLFDALGRPAVSQGLRFDGQAVFSHTTYDPLGRVVKREFPRTLQEMPTWESYEYDALDRLKARYLGDPTLPGPGTAMESYAYTVPGSHVTEASVTDATGRVKKALFDFRGLMVKSTEAAGTAQAPVVVYGYGAFGRLETTDDLRGSRSSLHYDQAGRVEHTEDPGAGRRYRSYNAFGEVKSEADDAPSNPERLVTVYERDELGRVVSATNAKEALSYGYDQGPGGIRQLTRTVRTPAGRPLDEVVTAYAYDGFGRLTDTTLLVDGRTLVTRQRYDAYGRLDKLTYPVAIAGVETALSYTYDTRGNLQGIGRANASQRYWSALAYDSAGRLKRARYGNGIERELRYDSRGQLRFIEARAGGSFVQRLAYEHAADGNLTARHDLMLGATETFAYDALDRLERWTVQQKCPGLEVQFGYDPTGNLLSRTTLRGTEPSTSLSYTGGTSGGPHAVKRATFGGTSLTYEYDHRGNQTRSRDGSGAEVRSIQYTPFNLPESITQAGETVRFDYDAVGTRVRKTGAGHEVLYAGGLYQQRSQGDSTTHILQVPSPEGVIAEFTWTEGSTGEEVRYFLNDLHGSPDTVTDASGGLVERIKYEPFGGRRQPADLTQASTVAHSGSRTGFTGHEQDDESGLINMRGRIYDPQLMRFLSVDPVIADPSSSQAYNAYAYVLNNPLRYTDPSGLSPWVTTSVGGGWTVGGPGLPTTRDMMADAYNRHMAAPEATPHLPAMDSRLPSISALDDAKAQPAAHHTNDIGQSAAPAASSRTSLLSTSTHEARHKSIVDQLPGSLPRNLRQHGLPQPGLQAFYGTEHERQMAGIEPFRLAAGEALVGGMKFAALDILTRGAARLVGGALRTAIMDGAVALQSAGRSASGMVSHGVGLLRAGLTRTGARGLNAYGDALRKVLGPGQVSHADEWASTLARVKEMGVTIEMRAGTMAYEPAMGRPGRLLLDPDASIGALRHEFQHVLDDAALGHPGLRIIADSNAFWRLEFRGYMQEISTARTNRAFEAGRSIVGEMRARRLEILGF